MGTSTADTPREQRKRWKGKCRQEKYPRRRTLDKFPMQHSHEDTTRTISAKRTARLQGQESAQRARQVSSSLSQYSKALFEDAVSRSSSGGARSALGLPRLDDERSRPPSYASFHSGPTTFGSPIYNNKVRLLNIKMRSSSEGLAAGPYNHERSRTSCTSDIQQVLQRSNTAFRVVTPGASTLPGSTFSVNWSSCQSSSVGGEYRDLILVPTQTIPEDVEDIEVYLTDRNLSEEDEEPAFQHMRPVLAAHSNSEKSGLNNKPYSTQRSQSQCPEKEELMNVSQKDDTLEHVSEETKNLKQENLNKPASKEEPVATVLKQKGVEISKAPQTNKHNGKLDKKTKGKQNSPRDNRSDSMTDSDNSDWKDHLVTWVDDVTVSSIPKSDKSAASEDPVPPMQSPRGGKGARPGKTVSVGKPGSKGQKEKDSKQVAHQSPLEEAMEQQQQANGKDTKVLSLQELQENQMTLPDFICPSSEDKSKQNRIKEWLEKTAFSVANRSVPLL